MANKELKKHKYHIPDNVKKVCDKYNLFNEGLVTYENLKKTKSHIENGKINLEDSDKDLLLGYIDKTLRQDRNRIDDEKDLKTNTFHQKNVSRQEHQKDVKNPTAVPSPSIYKLTESQLNTIIKWKKNQIQRND